MLQRIPMNRYGCTLHINGNKSTTDLPTDSITKQRIHQHYLTIAGFTPFNVKNCSVIRQW